MTFVMIPAGVLVYRDDTGKSVAEKLAAKARIFPAKPVLGTFLVMFAIINVSYFAYGGWFWAIKASGLATSVACPWPYPEAKVYDPQGYYEENGPRGRTRSASGPPGSGACRTAAPTSSWAPRAIGARPKARMAEPRSVVITGASRGLGFASAARLYRAGLACGRGDATVDAGMERLRQATGAATTIRG